MRIFVIILLFGIYNPLSAQFNISVGYSLGYTQAKQTNNLVYDYNKVFRDSIIFGNPMEELHFLHGLTVGLRWKYDRFSLEVNWENLNRTREALGEDDQDQLFQKTIFYAVNNYSASLESILGNFGFGIAAGLRNFQIKEQIASTDDKRSFLQNNQYFIKPFISLNLIGGEKVGLSIKPYISIPLNNIGLNPLSEELDLIPSDKSERLMMGGISFIFYNGNQ